MCGYHWRVLKSFKQGAEGFSFFELMVTMAVIGILMALAIPTVRDMQQSQIYKETARGMVSVLREAKSTAVAVNTPQMVVFKPNSSNYSWISYNNAGNCWNSVPLRNTKISSRVTMKSLAGGTSAANVSLQFNTNGTVTLKAPNGVVSDGNVSLNAGSVQKYVITVAGTGRVSLLRK